MHPSCNGCATIFESDLGLQHCGTNIDQSADADAAFDRQVATRGLEGASRFGRAAARGYFD